MSSAGSCGMLISYRATGLSLCRKWSNNLISIESLEDVFGLFGISSYRSDVIV